MENEKNILMDSPEEALQGSSKGTLLDHADAEEKPESGLQTLYDRIREFHQKGQYEEMLTVVQEAMKLDPSNGNIVLLMEAEPELMRLYRMGIAGVEAKAQAEAYFEDYSEEASADTKKEADKRVEEETARGIYPAGNVPFYTADEFHEFVKRYPNAKEGELLSLAEKEGRGFGFWYMASAKRAVENNTRHFWLDWYQLLRGAEQNGARGPKPESSYGFTMRNKFEDVELNFHYFCDDYKMMTENGNRVIDRNRAIVYRNGFENAKVEPSSELKELMEQIQDLERVPTYTEKEKRGYDRCKVFALIPMVVLLLNVLATYYIAAGSDGSGPAGIVFALINGAAKIWDSGIIGKILMFLPIMLEGLIGSVMLLVYTVAEIFEMKLAAAGLLTVVSVVLGLILRRKWMEWFDYETPITTKAIRKGKEAKERAEELRNGPEMKRLLEDEAKRGTELQKRKEQEEEWHKAWYMAYKNRIN